MNNQIYQIYQGEDLDIRLWPKNEQGTDIEIDLSIELKVDLVRISSQECVLSTSSNTISATRPDNYSYLVSIAANETKAIEGGDYSLSLYFEQGGRKIIEKINILRVIDSIHGRSLNP